MSAVTKPSAQLVKLSNTLNTLYSQMEKCYITICETMGIAREHFDDDDHFWEWVEEATPFAKNTAFKYLQVHDNVIETVAHAQRETIKTMPFSALQELAKENTPKSIKTKVIKQFAAAQKDEDKKAPTREQVRETVRQAVPTKRKRPGPQVVRKHDFDNRLEYADKHPVSAVWLFDLPADYCPETADILVKYWKRQYHPDKGGNKYWFALVSEKANELEVK